MLYELNEQYEHRGRQVNAVDRNDEEVRGHMRTMKLDQPGRHPPNTLVTEDGEELTGVCCIASNTNTNTLIQY